MILVTGATGHVGGSVAALLATAGLPVRLGVREPEHAPALPGAEVVRMDYGDAATLGPALQGVDRALVVSVYGPPGARARDHERVFEAAAAAGVGHVVYLSFQGASPDSRFPMSVDHFLSERFLAASGVRWTALRDAFYLDLLPSLFDGDAVLRAPAADGRVAFVAREDVARAAAAVLAAPSPPEGPVDVTGPEALSLADVARVLSVVAGRELRYAPEPSDVARARREQLNAPPWEVDAWVGSYEAFAAGELERTSDAVLRLTGEPPLSLDAWCALHPEALAPLRPQADGYPAAFV